MVNLKELGERALLRRIMPLIGKTSGIEEGAGEDDCAVIDLNGKEYLLATTDMLHKKTDFPDRMTARQIGWMSVAVNLSDIAAKGAHPIGLLMAAGLPDDLDVGYVEDIVRGMDECARAYGTGIIGGDTDSHDELTIVGTALGRIRKEFLVRRKGARPGDMLCVTGRPGTAGLALWALENGIDASEGVISALIEPKPRLKEGIKLAESGAVTSMMDLSDGLVISLYDMSRVNDTGYVIHEKLLPEIHDAGLLGHSDPLSLALYSGGDFELLFTVRPDATGKARSACDFTIIGEVLEKYNEGNIFIERNGQMEKLDEKGYEHFKNE